MQSLFGDFLFRLKAWKSLEGGSRHFCEKQSGGPQGPPLFNCLRSAPLYGKCYDCMTKQLYIGYSYIAKFRAVHRPSHTVTVLPAAGFGKNYRTIFDFQEGCSRFALLPLALRLDRSETFRRGRATAFEILREKI